MRNMERWEFIYNQINGLNEPDVCEWVRDESTPEGVLGPLVERAYAARDRLCARLGVDPAADEDAEGLVRAFEEVSRACGKLMYRYGCQDGQNVK